MFFRKNIMNPFLTVMDYCLKFTRLHNLPSIAAIETTSLCNLNCVICSRRFSERLLGTMDLALFERIIDQIKSSSRFTWLHLMGEPLMNPSLFEMIKICKSNGLRVGLSTNATLLNLENSRKILESGLDSLILAFDGVNKETYEKVRTGGVYEIVGHNIDQFLKLKKKMKIAKPWTIIQTVEINFTKDQIDEFVSRWKSEAVNEILIRKYSTGAGQLRDKDIVAMPEHRYLKEQKENRPPCFLLWNSAVIFWDGRVSACCHDCEDGKLVFGDLKKESLSEIWNNEKIANLRKMHLAGNFPSICKTCIEYPLFYPSFFYFLRAGIQRIQSKLKFVQNKEKKFVTHAREQSYF